MHSTVYYFNEQHTKEAISNHIKKLPIHLKKSFFLSVLEIRHGL